MHSVAAIEYLLLTLQAFVEENFFWDFAFRLLFDLLIKLWFKLLNDRRRQRSPLRKQTASRRDHEDQEAADHHYLEWCMKDAHSFEPVLSLKSLHDHR